MRALALLLAVLAAAGVLATHPGDVAAQSPAELTGAVRNGTAGGPMPAGVPVTLRYQLGRGEVVERHTTSADDGGFSFADLPPQGFPGFELRASYLGIEYIDRRLDQPLAGPVEITVYETTSDFTVLSLVDDTLAVTGADGSERQFAVLEAVKLRNAGDRTFQADVLTQGPMSMVRFSLPENAADLDVESSLPGGHVLQVDRGFALTMPVPPGDHDILYVYRVPYEGSLKQYTPNFPMGTESYRVLLVKGLAEGSGPGMRVADPVTVGETQYDVLEAGPFAPGMRAALTLSGLPQPTLFERAQTTVRSDGFRRGALPGLVGLVLVGMVAAALLRIRRPVALSRFRSVRPEPVEGHSPTVRPEPVEGQRPGAATHADLVTAIAQLDERFEAGELDDEAYRIQRAALVAQARGIE